MRHAFLAPLALLALSACGEEDAAGGAAAEPAAEEAVPVSLWRLDCGTVYAGDLNAFSDTDAYPGESKDLVDSCYLIRHGDEYMLWDAGLPLELQGHAIDRSADMDATITRTLAEQLDELGLAPADIGRVGISHYHFDHIGQLPEFPGATLLIGSGDWEALTAEEPAEGIETEPFARWIEGEGEVRPVEGDHDVFGDGSVVMLSTPGHTPGHHSLLVQLDETGPVLLTGDLAHFRENYESNGVPDFNTDRDRSIASIERFKRLAGDLEATVIVQHEAGDVDLLPDFSEAAR